MNDLMAMFNKRDIKGMASKFHPDIVMRDLNDNSIMLEGLETAISHYTEVFEKGCSTNSIVDMMEIDNKIVIKEHMIEPDGEEIDGFNLMEFEDGLIKRIWFLIE